MNIPPPTGLRFYAFDYKDAAPTELRAPKEKSSTLKGLHPSALRFIKWLLWMRQPEK
jgi:hypothetical protein